MKDFLNSPLIYLAAITLVFLGLSGVVFLAYKTGKSVCGAEVSQAALELVRENDQNKVLVNEFMGKLAQVQSEVDLKRGNHLLGTIRLIIAPRGDACVTPDEVNKMIGEIR